MKHWDVIIAGGGVIGLSLALELRRQSAEVLVVERHEPGREASSAAAGMLAPAVDDTPATLFPLASTSARMYPQFVRELETETQQRIDYRTEGTLEVVSADGARSHYFHPPISPETAKQLEPCLETAGLEIYFLEECSVDPRALLSALISACHRTGVDLVTGTNVVEVEQHVGRVVGVRTDRTRYGAKVVVNCCGAWSGGVGPVKLPTRPVKGQMCSLIPQRRDVLRHVLRSDDVYIVPRSDGRLLVGSTLEETGFDKRVSPETIQQLHQAAANLVPELGEALIQEVWAGLRPGTPDALPILGMTAVEGYYAACGHFRNGILLAPVTAVSMARLIRGLQPEVDLEPFSPARFELRAGTAFDTGIR